VRDILLRSEESELFGTSERGRRTGRGPAAQGDVSKKWEGGLGDRRGTRRKEAMTVELEVIYPKNQSSELGNVYRSRDSNGRNAS
jgi:hypothetical protein